MTTFTRSSGESYNENVNQTMSCDQPQSWPHTSDLVRKINNQLFPWINTCQGIKNNDHQQPHNNDHQQPLGDDWQPFNDVNDILIWTHFL